MLFHCAPLLTFLVFSDSSSSVLSTSFLKEGLFKGSWLQHDNIMSYLKKVGHSFNLRNEMTLTEYRFKDIQGHKY